MEAIIFFAPIAYKELHCVFHSTLEINTLTAYLLSGGSPIACAELAEQHFLPEYVIELTRDWIDGEIIRADPGIFNTISFRFYLSSVEYR